MSDPLKYTVGWISALPSESVAAQQFLDEKHDTPEQVAVQDNNVYTLGKISRHNIVMATLPKGEYGTTTAATVARDMLHSFPNIRIGLMVGIGGGAWTARHDVRLGDVVVSTRDGDQGGVFQYDFGKTIQNQTFHYTQHLNQPPQLLLNAVSGLETQYEAEGNQLHAEITRILEQKPRLRKKYTRPPASSDKLYRSDYVHRYLDQTCNNVCGEDQDNLVIRPERGDEDDNPAIHYGLIASANQLMKDAHLRDKLAAEKGVLCFEMEAAGLMNHFPCLVIRGICDYADTHKNKDWQGYAAMTAAAYAKELLQKIVPNKVEVERRISDKLDMMTTRIGGIEHAAAATKVAIDHLGSNLHSDKIRSWLRPSDPSTNVNHARKLRHPGTGAWLLDKHFFRSWCAGSSRHLWLHGLAGCGKTVLSTTVLDHLAQINHRLLLCFYFDFSDIEKQTVDSMLRSLAFQMYQYGGAFLGHLDALFRNHRDGRSQPSTDTLGQVVLRMLTESHDLYIILDALDESTTRNELLQWIQDIASRIELHHIHLLCTSRPEPEFQRNLPELIGQENCVLLDKKAVNADVRAHVTWQLAERWEFKTKCLSGDLIELIQCKVGDGADGMFRWAACQLDSLAACSSPNEMKKALRCLPKDLTETYERMLQSIQNSKRTSAIRLLQFLVHSQRPLTVLEAIEVIATEIQIDSQHFDIGNRVFDENEVLKFCPGLVSIVEANQFFGTTEKELHLAHFSVKEFLENQGDFGRSSASYVITRTCLTYLTDTGGRHDHIRQVFFMARFAAESWMSFAVSAESVDDVFQAILVFLNGESTFKRWRRLYQAGRSWIGDPGHPTGSRLYYVCLGGLLRVARELVNKGADINAQGGEYGSTLQAASYRGHSEIVKLLLDKGADINAQGGYFGSALQAASYKGYSEIIKLLLDKGADVNAQGGEYGNALQAASLKGDNEIVKLLLDKGADVNAQGGEYGNALQAASYRGYSEIIKLLLDKGADRNYSASAR
uniref:NACHT domain-containing protein n=1 Tax=Bionectria ochroleuca TaxID=29856 RepID=A0A0B7JWZ5_BIOOC